MGAERLRKLLRDVTVDELHDALAARSSSSSTNDAVVTTRNGSYRYKYHMRAIFQSIAFVGLMGFFMVYNGVFSRESSELVLENEDGRHLELKSCDDIEKIEPGWMTTFYALGVLYMFLALAIVCDEFFVPALEEMSSARRMNLSMDVAGATLMAAGGSAPELFSSLFGTFRESEIGFGTIIGSAVFNVLFVIAMCTIFAKEVLTLTWWPLFRDCLYYTIGIVVLGIFVGVNTPDQIDLWEAIVLFLMYIGYCLIMWKNADIYKYLTGKELVYPDEETDGMDDDSRNGRGAEIEMATGGRKSSGDLEKQPSNSSIASAATLNQLSAAVAKNSGNVRFDFRWQGTFRAGILKLFRSPENWVEAGGVGIVAKIAGDAEAVFREIDANGDGHIDKDELRRLFTMLECRMSDHELDEVFKELDTDQNGIITEDEFQQWYTSSTELIRSQTRHIFDELDTNKDGTLCKFELKALLIQLDPHVSDSDVEQAISEMYKSGSREEITFDEFEEWYEKSMIYERQKKAVEEDMEGVWENLKPPFGEGWGAWIQYIIVSPLVFAMVITIPDVRIPGRGKYCYLAFFLSIAWIGAFAYLMVSWAELIGNTFGIPSVIMGLTVLAAGTSVPDLLSSVIVARRGSGDMAVSSSIGSNIFDILVGLPVPWILYLVWPTTKSIIEIDSGNIFISLVVLLGMLVIVISAVHCQGWKLTKTLGGIMMVFYVLFLVQAIVVDLPFETCV